MIILTKKYLILLNVFLIKNIKIFFIELSNVLYYFFILFHYKTINKIIYIYIYIILFIVYIYIYIYIYINMSNYKN